MEYQLRMLLDFQKRKKHSPAARVFTLSENLATSPVHG